MLAHFERHLSDLIAARWSEEWETAARAAIVEAGGLAAKLPRRARRSLGIFPTPPRLAKAAGRKLSGIVGAGECVADPTVGLGDLLLPLLASFRPESDFADTIEKASDQFCGHDIRPDLVQLARLRLLLATRLRFFQHEPVSRTLVRSAFRRITVRQVNANSPLDLSWKHIILNPPFNQTQYPRNLAWSSGRGTIAATIAMLSLEHVALNTKGMLSAILPESLRSGPRYRAWRETVQSLPLELTEAPTSRLPFSGEADIHVYILQAAAGHGHQPSRQSELKSGSLGRAYEVRIGPVVPHRDPTRGHDALELDSRMLAARAKGITLSAKAAATLPKKRRLSRIFQGPILVIPRTSRPEQRPRLRAVVVSSREGFHIENHLIVVSSGRTASLRHLARYLRSDKVSSWMNRRSRLRHISATILRQLPLAPRNAD